MCFPLGLLLHLTIISHVETWIFLVSNRFAFVEFLTIFFLHSHKIFVQFQYETILIKIELVIFEIVILSTTWKLSRQKKDSVGFRIKSQNVRKMHLSELQLEAWFSQQPESLHLVLWLVSKVPGTKSSSLAFTTTLLKVFLQLIPTLWFWWAHCLGQWFDEPEHAGC